MVDCTLPGKAAVWVFWDLRYLKTCLQDGIFAVPKEPHTLGT